MNLEQLEPLSLKSSPLKGSLWVYTRIGLLIGAGAGALAGHPIAMVVKNLHEARYYLTSFHPEQIIRDSFVSQFLDMKLLSLILGGITGSFLGIIFRRLQEDRLGLEALQNCPMPG